MHPIVELVVEWKTDPRQNNLLNENEIAVFISDPAEI